MDRKPEYARIRLAFGASSYFHALPAASLDALAAAASLDRCSRGGVLQPAGTLADKFWLVVDGGLLVNWPNARGEHVPVALIGAGSFYSASVFVDGTAPPGECVADRETVLACIPGARLRSLLAQDAALREHLPRMLLQRFFAAVSFYADAVSAPLPDRIARRLLSQALATMHDANASNVELRTSQSDLARIVGASRSKVNAELRRLENAKVLRLGYRRLYVTDCRQLERLAGGLVPAL